MLFKIVWIEAAFVDQMLEMVASPKWTQVRLFILKDEGDV